MNSSNNKIINRLKGKPVNMDVVGTISIDLVEYYILLYGVLIV